jgi:hypothetical protein
MLWQLLQVTSFLECLPDSQKASWRLPPWQGHAHRGLLGRRALRDLVLGLLRRILEVLGSIAVAGLAHPALRVVLGPMMGRGNRGVRRFVAGGADGRRSRTLRNGPSGHQRSREGGGIRQQDLDSH